MLVVMALSKSSVAVVSVVSVPVILFTAAYLIQTNGKNTGTQNVASTQTFTTSASHSYLPITTVPEANTGLVMIPFFGAVLAFSVLRLFRTSRPRQL
jgi:hypothetical protein